ncbi:MAG TPA: hypothetical protein VGE01_09635 [Fimbriimonas sp.]
MGAVQRLRTMLTFGWGETKLKAAPMRSGGEPQVKFRLIQSGREIDSFDCAREELRRYLSEGVPMSVGRHRMCHRDGFFVYEGPDDEKRFQSGKVRIELDRTGLEQLLRSPTE